MEKNQINTAIRTIQKLVATGDLRHALTSLEALERNLPDCNPEAYEMPEIVGFDTVLSYLSREIAVDLDLTLDPVRDTIADGRTLSKRARERGLPVLKVAAPAAVTQRYGKITHVNAYPTHLLAEYFA